MINDATTRSHTCRALLFDRDGTLLNSTDAANRAWGAWAAANGLGENFTLQGATHGRQRHEIIKYLLPDISDSDALRGAEGIRLAEITDVEGVVALPGAVELLDSLAPHQWAVVTSADEATATARLRAAGLPVPAAFFPADLVPMSKPHPMGFLMAAEALGVAPEDAIVFEDAPAGIQAGVAAGMRVIGSRHTQDDDALLLAGAMALIDNPAQVATAINASGELIIDIR